MTAHAGLFATLTDRQKAFALSYRGPETIGPAIPEKGGVMPRKKNTAMVTSAEETPTLPPALSDEHSQLLIGLVKEKHDEAHREAKNVHREYDDLNRKVFDHGVFREAKLVVLKEYDAKGGKYQGEMNKWSDLGRALGADVENWGW